jgi:serine/threonine-protein kinase
MTNYTSEEELAALGLVEQVLDLEPGERARAIKADAEASDRVKERALELVLQASSSGSGVFTRGAEPYVMQLIGEPERIGAYRLVEEIGRGGMGIVYRAVRDAGDFEHEAAIKMILTGRLSPRLVQRFMYERQTLASLNHPGIARLFDGGETDEGLPYLTMELVEGLSLRNWLQAAPRSRADRFAVIDQLLDALQYAHARLVIHRDLTPDNVIIDAQGRVKLIDFGLSSLQSLRQGDADAADLFTGHSGTPGFSPPESALEAQPSVAMDIYALGKLIDFMFPETTDPELIAIMKRAAAEMPEDRYETVAALTADLARLREGRSVVAYDGGAGYRLRKFAGRNWLPVSAAATVLIAVFGALVLVTGAYNSERRARELAQERFDAVRDLANFQLFEVYDALNGTPGSTSVLSSLIERSQAYLENLSQSDRGDADLQFEAARAFLRLARIQGDPLGSSLGFRTDAQSNRATGVAMLRTLYEQEPDDRRYRLALADGIASQSHFANHALDDVEAAVKLAREARRIARQGSMDRELHTTFFHTRTLEAEPLPWVGETEKALQILSRADEYWQKHIGNGALTAAEQSRRAKFLGQRAQATAFLFEDKADGKLAEEALKGFAEAIEVYRDLARQGFETKTSLRNISIGIYERTLILSLLQREPQALTELKEAERLMRNIIADDPADQEALNTLSTVLSHKVAMSAFTGKAGSVLGDAEEMIALQQRLLAIEPDNRARKIAVASVALNTADAFEKAGQSRRACEFNRMSESVRDELSAERELDDYLKNAIFNDIPERIERTCA